MSDTKKIHKFGLMLTRRAVDALHNADFDLSDVKADIAAARRHPDNARKGVRHIMASAGADEQGWLDYADEVVRIAAGVCRQ